MTAPDEQPSRLRTALRTLVAYAWPILLFAGLTIAVEVAGMQFGDGRVIFVLLLALTAMLWFAYVQQPRRSRPHRHQTLCLNCQYPLDELRARTCPECGQKFDPADSDTVRRSPPGTMPGPKALTLAALLLLLALLLLALLLLLAPLLWSS